MVDEGGEIGQTFAALRRESGPGDDLDTLEGDAFLRWAGNTDEQTMNE